MFRNSSNPCRCGRTAWWDAVSPEAAGLKRETATDVLEEAYAYLKPRSLRIADATHGSFGNGGSETRYCERIGCDPATLHWYHGLEYLDTWRWVLKTGEDFEGHSVETIEADLQCRLDHPGESVRS